MKIKINDKEVNTIGFFAYDGCHKIYILETKEELEEALEVRYEIIPIEKIKEFYKKSCPLRFIENWGLTTRYCEQLEEAKIDEEYLDFRAYKE